MPELRPGCIALVCCCYIHFIEFIVLQHWSEQRGDLWLEKEQSFLLRSINNEGDPPLTSPTLPPSSLGLCVCPLICACMFVLSCVCVCVQHHSSVSMGGFHFPTGLGLELRDLWRSKVSWAHSVTSGHLRGVKRGRQLERTLTRQKNWWYK